MLNIDENMHYEYENLSIETRVFDIIDERMYIIRCNGSIFIVDPFVDKTLIEEAGRHDEVSVFLTHEHFDHISGVNALREVTNLTVYGSKVCAEYVKDEKRNFTKRFPLLFLTDRDKMLRAREYVREAYECSVDISFEDELCITWNGHSFKMVKSPGHSAGSSMMVVDNNLLFSGDSVLGNEQELRSLNASREDFHRYVVKRIKAMDGDNIVFPGHGERDVLSEFIKKIDAYPSELT